MNHSNVRSSGLATIAQMVAAGLGVTLLPAHAVPVEARPGSGVTTRPFETPAPGRDIALIWRTGDPRGPAYEELVSKLGALLDT